MAKNKYKTVNENGEPIIVYQEVDPETGDTIRNVEMDFEALQNTGKNTSGYFRGTKHYIYTQQMENSRGLGGIVV